MEFIENNKTNITAVQLSTVKERVSKGKALYRWAWTVEIIAAIVGLFVAWYQGIDAFNGYKEVAIEAGRSAAELSNSLDSFKPENIKIPDAQWADVILGGLPFIMVAIAEVLKVPIVYLVYINRNIITKFAFSIVLVGLTFITFETVSAGFERQFSNVTANVRAPKSVLDQTEKRLNILSEKIEYASSITPKNLSNDYSNVLKNLQQSYNNDIKIINKSISDTLKRKNGDLETDINEKKSELKQLKEDRGLALQEAKDAFKDIQEAKSSELSALRLGRVNEIHRIQGEIDKLDNKITKSMNDSQKNSFLNNRSCDDLCKSWKKERESLIKSKASLESNTTNNVDTASDYNSIIKKINKRFNSKIKELKSEIKELKSTLRLQSQGDIDIESYENDKKIRTETYALEKESAKKDYEGVAKQLELDKEQLKDWKSESVKLDKLKEEKEKEMRKYEASNQMFRFTRYRMNFAAEKVCDEFYKDSEMSFEDSENSMTSFNWFGLFDNKEEIKPTKAKRKACKKYKVKEVKISDVTMEDVTKTAFWWYGSLAVLVSIMGVVLAFGAFILMHPNEKYLNKGKRYQLSNTIRRMFVSLRKRIKEPKIITKTKTKEVPKEVIKEVPVQKVVLTEVPVEIVKKEVFYEPLYTKDPDLLKFGTAKVKDILSRSNKDKKKTTRKNNEDS
ncbi:MAG: hypothetical protein ISR69_05895 [Gammaproteobacteria bacterium]|nr:hypothetical protein [archaeon]MBL7003538.1 hypothetical protein [Gammaproteobacteria bacterium]